MSKKYVLDGAPLECSCGTKPAKLQVTENQKVRIQGKLQATDRDVQVPQTFGQCKLKPSGGGYLPCVPALRQWTKTAHKATLGGSKKFLFEDSQCPCATGGKVTVARHGQIATMGEVTEAFKTIARSIPGAMPGADRAPKVVESYWMDAEGNRQISEARYGETAGLLVRTEYVEAGQGLSVMIKEKSRQTIDGSRRFLRFSGTVGADGAARLDPLSTGRDWNTHPGKPTNRLRRLYMEISVAGRAFAYPEQMLTLKPVGAAEVTDAFLARKKADPEGPATYQRIAGATLGQEVYVVVAYTGDVEGIRASLGEKEPLLSDGPLPVLQNGTHTTILQLQQSGEENRMVAKVTLRPESEEQLDKWRQKLQGEDGEEKKSLLSIRVVAESPEEVVYHGTNNSNLFLAEEGDWFEVENERVKFK